MVDRIIFTCKLIFTFWYFYMKMVLKLISSVLDVSNCSFVQFQIWDLPGSDHVNIFDTANFDTESIIMGCAAIVFVIDAQVKMNSL